ncbi:MAG: M6 family metalloprotease domain-containing protein [Muribaculaceae bacterium]|nr:M6 family metalloprotease domain-containing protein [Muribaculaceae bacterium]
MKRILFAALAAAVSSAAAYAVPAKPGLKKTVTGPDGAEVTVAVVGDENFHYFVAPDGRPMQELDDGTCVYVDPEAVRAKAKARKNAGRGAASRAASDYNISQVPHVGSPRVPVILVDYTDKKFLDGDNANVTFWNFFSNGDKSAYQYFVDQSNGRFTPRFDVYGPYHLSNNRRYYGGNDSSGNDQRPGTMVAEACIGLDGEIDFSLYDNNGDGECDVVIVLYAGVGEASSDVAESVWPHQWDLYSSDYGRNPRLDGVTVGKYAVFNEVHGEFQSQIDGIGTFCHEFSHCLGLPDFYDTQYGGHFGMGPWSLMDYGSYNDDTYTPIGYSAYEKWFMGWIDDIPEPTPGTTVTLPVFNQKNAATDVAYRLANPSNDNEYYVLENRAKQGWDSAIEAEGLMIYHVTYDAYRWYVNEVNDYSPECMAIVAADNQRTDGSAAGDLFPYRTVDSFTATSRPAATLNYGSKTLDKPVTDIRRDSNGEVTFRYIADALPPLDAPEFGENLPTAGDLLAGPTGFTAKWPAVDSEFDITYTIDIRPHSFSTSVLALDEDCTGGTTSWTTDGYVDADGNAVRLGSSNRTGSMTSPNFTVSSGEGVTLFFSAASYNSDGSSLKVDVLNANGTSVASQTVALAADYATYRVQFPAVTDGARKVCLQTTAKKKRVMLEWVKVYDGDADEPADAPSRAAADKPVNPATETRQIAGIKATEYAVTGLTPGGVYDWKVKACAVNPDDASDSAWSKTVTVELPVSSALEAVYGSDNAAPVEYFDLSGRRLKAPAASGFYIERRGSAVAKRFAR